MIAPYLLRWAFFYGGQTGRMPAQSRFPTRYPVADARLARGRVPLTFMAASFILPTQ